MVARILTNTPKVVEILRKIFTKPGKIKFSNVHLLAVMLGALNRHHQDFAISVLDGLLEKITVGLEVNDFKYNQRRIAEVKYLGELYIYRMVDAQLIFDTLNKVLNYGHGESPTRIPCLCLAYRMQPAVTHSQDKSVQSIYQMTTSVSA